MTEVSTNPSLPATFADFLKSEANNDEICYFRDVFSDAGLWFPDDAEDFIRHMGYEGDDNLISAVDTIALEMEYAGQSLLKMIKRYENLKKMEAPSADI